MYMSRHMYMCINTEWLLCRRAAVGGGGGFPARRFDSGTGERNVDVLSDSGFAGQYGGSVPHSKDSSGMHFKNKFQMLKPLYWLLSQWDTVSVNRITYRDIRLPDYPIIRLLISVGKWFIKHGDDWTVQITCSTLLVVNSIDGILSAWIGSHIQLSDFLLQFILWLFGKWLIEHGVDSTIKIKYTK